MMRFVVIIALFCASLGCHSSNRYAERMAVSGRISERFQHFVPTHRDAGSVVIPDGVSLDDGVTEDEAVLVALWNNATFHAVLHDLGIAHSDLIQAGLLPNPEMVYFFPGVDKPLKYAFELPIEAIWLRPHRFSIAHHDMNQASQRLTQSGLDLIRDTRQSYADVVLAKERVRLSGETLALRRKIAELAEKRLKSGDISELDAAAAKIDALNAEQENTRIGFEIGIAEERLRNLMGLGANRTNLKIDTPVKHTPRTLDVESLTQDAVLNRPDAEAAREAIGAAEARLRFAKLSWFRFLGVFDATSGRASGHEFSPALRFTLPIFNRNQGGIARAEAEYERAVHNHQAVCQQVILDIQRAYQQYRQACAEIEVLRARVRPEVEAAIQRAKAAHEKGNVTIVIVLETTRQLQDNWLREAQLEADLRRTWAELERSVGRKLKPAEKPCETPSLQGPFLSLPQSLLGD